MSPAFPPFSQFQELARGATVVPVHREVMADALTPVLAKQTLGRGPGTFLLESVVGGERWARYSFVGVDPVRIIRGVADRFEIVEGGEVHREDGVDAWERLREELARHRPPEIDWLPRFWGGAVGYVAYDAVRRFEPTVGKGLTRDDEWEFCFGIGATVLIFDNVKQSLRVVAPAWTSGDDLEAAYRDATARVDRVLASLETPRRVKLGAPPSAHVARELPASNMTREEYEAAVRTTKEHIAAGDIFQAVVSQRFRVPAEGVDLFEVYRAMRAVNPSPYMFFLDLDEVTIAGASPETLVRLEEGEVTVRPIAGTRHRGKNEIEDEAIARELLADPKDRSEHVMLLDLGRNDVGRISKPGTVRVTEEMLVERYSHVMHIVSNVVGEIAEGRDALDVLAATFPAGTLSGAPKVRAMQIIEELEVERRGIYGGAVGYIGFGGNMDVAIAIRTVVATPDEIRLQSGAGLVALSDPTAEWEETVNKAKAGLVSIEAGRVEAASEREA
jgi:anthranilate synthase component I